MTKIEPVATVDFADTGDYSQEWFAELVPNAHQITTIKVGTKLYTEAQMRQLVEACAQVAGPEDSYQDEWFNAKADAVNKINARIKELLS